MKTSEEKINEIIEIIDDVIRDIKTVRDTPAMTELKQIFEYESLTENQMVEAIKCMLGYGQDGLETELTEEIRKFIRKWNK